MMYEVTFNLPHQNATYTIEVTAGNRDEAKCIATEALMNNVITEIKEQKIDGNIILDWILDQIPDSDTILLRTGITATIFNRHDAAQMVILAERLYYAFEDFAEDNESEDCSTVEGLFNYCITKNNPDFGNICSVYYEQSCGNFILAF